MSVWGSVKMFLFQLIILCLCKQSDFCCRLTKFSRQIRCYTTSSDAKESPTTQTTIDEDEHRKFVKLAAQWWDEKGEFYALHSMNKLRIPLIRDALVNNMDSLSHILPLKDKHILDVGSGGGIIAEVCSNER